jgi:hypothetical protein
MTSSFNGQEVPTDKLFVLYYPPSMVHLNWSHSVYAAARANEALSSVSDELKNFRQRYVVGPKFYFHMLIGAVGLCLLALWAWTLALRGTEAGFLSLFVAPFVGLILTLYGRFRYRAFAARKSLWDNEGRATSEKELSEIQSAISKLSGDPTAEEAAPVLRRECPEVFSTVAFQGANFRAFTYLDFVLFRQLKNPTQKEELPEAHSLNRDAYYVGDVVYDSWRTFQRDRQDQVDPRFVGSNGRRGVL